jgi:hypothetical protein
MVHKIWKSIDAWRGYYTYEPTIDDVKIGSDDEVLLTECNFVSHEDNEKFVDITKKALRKHFNIRIKHGQTSNVFSGNVIVLAKPKAGGKWNHGLKKIAKQADELFVDYYTRGFSIFSGTTSPIDLKEYKEKLELVV